VAGPLPSGPVADTVTVPLPGGTTTVSAEAEPDTTLAVAPPKVMVAPARPSPFTVTWVPAGAWPGSTEVTSAQARPAAIGDPRPLARS